MNNTGWIKISRKIKDWQHYHNGYVFHVFMDLLLDAFPKQRVVKGKTIEAGQVVVSIAKIKANTGIKSNHTVIDALKSLVESGEITKERIGNETIVTINNFATYQGYAPNAQPSSASDAQPDTAEVVHEMHNPKCTTCTTSSALDAQPHLIDEDNKLSSFKELIKEPSKEGVGAVQKPSKLGYEKFGQDGLVELKPSEYRTLIEQNTEDDVKAVIEDLNDKLAIGADDELINSKSHYHVLRYWLRCRKDKQAAQPKKTAWKVDLNALKI